MILHLTQDLMMSSTASALARSSDRTYKMVASTERLAAIADENGPALVLVDLQTPGLQLSELDRWISERLEPTGSTAIAYAQHVAVDELRQASECGFTKVLTRGQLNRQLAELIQTL